MPPRGRTSLVLLSSSAKSDCPASCVPFSSLNPRLLFSPRYFFPRQLLIRYFWTPNQQVEFLDAYDAIRRDSYPDVVECLALAARSLPEPQLQKRLQELCAEVRQRRGRYCPSCRCRCRRLGPAWW